MTDLIRVPASDIVATTTLRPRTGLDRRTDRAIREVEAQARIHATVARAEAAVRAERIRAASYTAAVGLHEVDRLSHLEMAAAQANPAAAARIGILVNAFTMKVATEIEESGR